MHPLDDAATIGAHRRSTLLQAGLRESELRGPLWSRSAHGHYAWASADLRDTRHRIHAAAARIRSLGVVTGWAAAWLHGATDLDGHAGPGMSEHLLPVPICTSPDYRLSSSPRDVPQVRASRSRLDEADVVELDGVRCASLVRAAFDAARFAPDLTEAVVALDCLLRDTSLDLGDLVTYTRERRCWQGRAQVLRAGSIASRWSLSCQESRLRVLWQTVAGLPEPLVNRTILDESGRTLAMADLFDEAAWLVGEYDGAYHAAAAQRGADDERSQRLFGVGLHVVRVVAPDLLPDRRQRTAGRLRALRAERLAQVRGRRRTWSLAARRPATTPTSRHQQLSDRNS